MEVGVGVPQQLRVGDGYFWLLRPSANESMYEFGISDEASKINLNVAKAEQLILLPGITQ